MNNQDKYAVSMLQFMCWVSYRWSRAESTVVAARDAVFDPVFISSLLAKQCSTQAKDFLCILVSTLDPTEMLNITFLWILIPRSQKRRRKNFGQLWMLKPSEKTMCKKKLFTAWTMMMRQRFRKMIPFKVWHLYVHPEDKGKIMARTLRLPKDLLVLYLEAWLWSWNVSSVGCWNTETLHFHIF